ncbi:MAG TPA: MFS transporter [Steroidobacteraceae bacterium]|nr:MFS transporter [Steroidobacteraceae bacterium]
MPASALSPFRYPIFRHVWIANRASQFGGMIQQVGAAWLMLSIASSAGMVTLVQASSTLPIVMLALVAGALADNFDRRRMMIAAQVFMLVVSTALAVCTYLGLTTPWLLLSFTFLIGAGNAFNGPAWHASVGEMVAREELPAAVALNSMGFNAARSFGPAIGGVLVAAAGAAAAFAVNVVTYVGIVAVLARWRRPLERRLLPRERLGMAVLAGIRYVAMSPHISSTLVRGLVFGAGASALTALMPLIARDLIGGNSVTYGVLLGAFGIGAVVGAFLSHRLRQLLKNEMIVRCGHVAFAVAATVSAFSTWLPATTAAMLLAGAGWLLTLATFNVTAQTSAPRWVVARALSLYQVATFGGIAAGSWLWGLLTERYGLASALVISAGVLLIGAALGWRLAVPQTEDLDLDPLGRWKEPEIAVKIEPRSGPVVVTIEYRIHEDDVLEFLAAMSERRRIRRRDGARRWTLLRDLGDHELWIERYHSPTWLDYVRQNQRVTQDDAAVMERIQALHRGPERPRVRRMIERQTSVPPGGPVPGARELAEPITDPARVP